MSERWLSPSFVGRGGCPPSLCRRGHENSRRVTDTHAHLKVELADKKAFWTGLQARLWRGVSFEAPMKRNPVVHLSLCTNHRIDTCMLLALQQTRMHGAHTLRTVRTSTSA